MFRVGEQKNHLCTDVATVELIPKFRRSLWQYYTDVTHSANIVTTHAIQ
jgi:hypothetical protein